MFRDKKLIIRLLLLTLSILIFLSSPAAAAITGFVGSDEDGRLYEYSYADLLDSYALKILGLSNGLYEDFAAKKAYALLGSSGRYFDYVDVLDCYASALILQEVFDLNKYMDSKEARMAQMPASISMIRLNAGKLIYTSKTISSSITESNPIVENPKTKTLIVGPAEVSLEQARQWASNRAAAQGFINIAPIYWEYGEKTGIRPEVLYAQSAVETNFGKYTGKVPSIFNNWAGIKTANADGDKVYDHEIFATPEDGVRAHFNHMSAYVGLDPLGEPHGRYYVAAGQTWAGLILYVEELSGKWAPRLDYHTSILNLLDQLKHTVIVTGSPAIENEGSATASESVSGSENTALKHVAVNVELLRLRSGPGTNYSIIDLLPLGTVLKTTGNQEEWLKVTTPGEQNGWIHGDYVREVDMSVDPFKGKTIVVDPGHGGSDHGAIGVTGLQEKELNLAVAHKLATLLKEAGASVLMTRDSDQPVSNGQRVDIANQAKADLFISIHANAYVSNESNGTETHYCSEKNHSNASRYLAYQVQNELMSVLNLRNRGVKANNFYVLKNTEIPAALVELAFISNPAEEEILRNEQTHSTIAQALYRGLEAYLLNYR